MVKIVCDRCGQNIDIDLYTGYIVWNFRDHASGKVTEQNIFENCDYCEECMEEIRAFITHGHTQTPTEPINTDSAAGTTESTPPAAGQTTEDKAGKRNSRIDMGKVNALRDAGWSIGKIAEEMNVDPAEVAEKIYDRKRQEKAAGI